MKDFVVSEGVNMSGTQLPKLPVNEDEKNQTYLQDVAAQYEEMVVEHGQQIANLGKGYCSFNLVPEEITCKDMLDKLVEIARTRGISDIQLRAGQTPYIRNGDGVMEPLFTNDIPIPEYELYLLCEELTRGTNYFDQVEKLFFRQDDQRILLPNFKEQINGEGINFVYPVEFNGEVIGRFRCNIFLSLSGNLNTRGLSVALRNVPLEPMKSVELGFNRAALGLVNRLYNQKITEGLVLIVGPTGSGKSLSLASILEEINQRLPVHILTFEDPVEIFHRNKKAFFTQIEVGTCVDTFHSASKNSLRQNPNIVVYHEVRDSESAKDLIAHAGTGHLVFATMHAATTAADGILKLVQMTENPEAVASHLVAVIAQRLIPSVRGSRSGMPGRQLVMELCMPSYTNQIRQAIADRKNKRDLNGLMDEAAKLDTNEIYCCSFEAALLEAVRDGKIEPVEAYRNAFRKDNFQRLVREMYLTKEKHQYQVDPKKMFFEFEKQFWVVAPESTPVK
jgi:Tfp pilus assembly pilus retraction ATPase PilT